MPLKEPSDLGGGRGLNLYGGGEIILRDGGVIWVQDSSAASSPHIRMYFYPSVHGSPQPHLDLESVIELRDRLNQAIRETKENWGEGWVRSAYRKIAARRAAENGGEKT